jgi:hypothetical protein
MPPEPFRPRQRVTLGANALYDGNVCVPQQVARPIKGRDFVMKDDADQEAGPRAVPPAAARALAEAEARRKARGERLPEHSAELGRAGPDPTRYGDWEKGGIASDF